MPFLINGEDYISWEGPWSLISLSFKGGGFFLAADCEKKIGVVHLRLATFEREGCSDELGGVVGVVGVLAPGEPCKSIIGGGVGLLRLEQLEKVGLANGLIRLVVRERRVGLDMCSSLSSSLLPLPSSSLLP